MIAGSLRSAYSLFNLKKWHPIIFGGLAELRFRITAELNERSFGILLGSLSSTPRDLVGRTRADVALSHDGSHGLSLGLLQEILRFRKYIGDDLLRCLAPLRRRIRAQCCAYVVTECRFPINARSLSSAPVAAETSVPLESEETGETNETLDSTGYNRSNLSLHPLEWYFDKESGSHALHPGVPP